MKRIAAMAIGLALACGGPGEPDPAPAPEPTPQPQPSDPQPPPPADPQPPRSADPQPTPPPADPQPQPPAPDPPAARCFLEESGHGTWRYGFTGVEGSCESGHEFTSDMPPGTSFLHTGPIPPDGDRWHCETQSNAVSSDKCRKVITRHCWAEDVSIELVDEFHQDSATKVTFSLDEQWETGPLAGRYTCHARYHGVMEKQ